MHFQLHWQPIPKKLLTKLTLTNSVDWPYMVANSFNSSTWQVESGRSLWVWGQLDLYSNFQASSWAIEWYMVSRRKNKRMSKMELIYYQSNALRKQNLRLNRVACACNPRIHETEARWSGVKTLGHKTSSSPLSWLALKKS